MGTSSSSSPSRARLARCLLGVALLAGHREDEYRNLVLLGGRKLFRGKNGFVEKSTHESHQTLI